MKKVSLLIAALGLHLCLFPQTGAATERLAELRKERSEINRAIRKAIPDASKLDPELARLGRVSIDATKAHLQALKAAPELKAVNADLEKANQSLTDAIVAKNESAKQAALAKMTELQYRRLEEAGKIPALAKLAETKSAAGVAYMNREKEVVSSQPETKELTARLEKINTEIQVEMKKR